MRLSTLIQTLLVAVGLALSAGAASGQSLQLMSYDEHRQPCMYSSSPIVSGEGRYVYFRGYCGADGSSPDGIFARDLETGTTTLASVDARGQLLTGYPLSVTRDGRFLVFRAQLSNGINTSQNRYGIFVRDIVAGSTVRIAETSVCGANVVISDDGETVAFEGGTIPPGSDGECWNRTDIYVWHRESAQIVRASAPLTAQTPLGTSNFPVITGDGRYVFFNSTDDHLVPGDANGESDVFRYDTQSQTNTIVSVNVTGTATGNAASNMRNYLQSFDYQISTKLINGDGRYVVFESYSNDLVSGDNNGKRDVFVRDMVSGTTTLVSSGRLGLSNGDSYNALISGNGRFILFNSRATNLVRPFPGLAGSLPHVFVFDRETGTTRWITQDPPRDGNSSNYRYGGSDISDDGRYVTYQVSYSSWSGVETHLRDLQTGEHLFFGSAFESFGTFANSIGGHTVVFASSMQLLPADTNGGVDVYVYRFPDDSRVEKPTAPSNKGSR